MSAIEEIVRVVEKGGYDLVVGFGGGSPIDVAKAAAVLPHTGDTVYDYVGIDQVKKKGLPIIAVPTTSRAPAPSAPPSPSSPTRSST